MKEITFKNINIIGNVIVENELYKQVHYPEMIIRYDSNFIEFKKMPSLIKLQEAETYLRDFHKKHNQQHVKFYFPENEKPCEEILTYLRFQKYDIGFLELYAIQPENFPAVDNHPEIDIQEVNEQNFNAYIKLQYEIDRQFGEDFAKQKIDLNTKHYFDSGIMQIIAYYQGEPVGSMDVIISDETAEIDGLEVKKAVQRKGIGSRLQQYVMDKFSDKTIILVADGEDTPKEMYKRQGYQYLGYQYEVQKIEEPNKS
ncbi:GNAT family N-acetyltransferase [Oceanobacillus halophilus]|uniref:N-acetyltransferase n=1 Tax=Oceanobacillus halophilus TaxID=930130 RepID=A0A494ZSN5_9BACI|nr:GNAT family N-acetyltransferase [Oceanobacillus halophilus]RKQ29070.1 N-acetyltransferase [Oceanobacillus halophilus]